VTITREQMARAYELRTDCVSWKVIARDLGVNWQSLRIALKRAGADMGGQRFKVVTPEIIEFVRQMKVSGKMCWWSVEQATGVGRHTIRAALRRLDKKNE
jgi:DNA invertase Pin-like site-specific DNA recombinase